MTPRWVAAVIGAGIAVGSGCHHAAPPPAPTVAATPAVARPAAPVPAVSAREVPHVEFGEDLLTPVAMPAVSADGTTILVGHVDGDGGRGNPNLTLLAFDRTDRRVKTLVVMTADEASFLLQHRAIIEARVELANRWLAELDARARFVEMSVMSSVNVTDCHCVESDRATATWLRSAILRIEVDRRVVSERATPSDWLAVPSGTCRLPLTLRTGYVDIERRAALIVVGYEGSDTCWEPSVQEHVIAW